MFRFWLPAALLLAACIPALAQPVYDDFADGDFTSDPGWTGDADRFTVAPLGDGFALRSNGPPHADTLLLATASSVATGHWAFTFRHEVNLSTANGARVYLLADTPDLKGNVRGYYLQFGTNNLDRVELWRQDGPPTQRTRLGASDALLPGDAGLVRLEVARDEDGHWIVQADGAEVIGGVMDASYTASAAMGVWVKHSAANGARFYFTGFETETVDNRPPGLLQAEAFSETEVRVWFSEPLAACPPGAFVLLPGNQVPEVATCHDAGQVDLTFGQPLTGPASYTLVARGMTDLAGNVQSEATTSFFFGRFDVPEPGELVINEIMYAPDDLASNEYVEVLNTTTDRTFDLADLRLANAASEPRPVVSASTPLSPGGYAVLVRDPEAFAARFAGVPFLTVARFPALLNSGDTVRILHADGTPLDAVPYRSSWGGQGMALERRSPGGASHSLTNWAPSPAPPGGTPGTPNAVAPDTWPPTPLAVTPSDDGRTVRVLFDEPLASPTVTPEAFVLSGGGGVPDTASLEEGGAEVLLRWSHPFPPGLYTLSIYSVKDLVGNILRESSLPVLLGSFEAPRPGEIALTEVMYREAEGGTEYVELLNLTDRPFDLRALSLSDGRGRRHIAEAPAVLPPGGYLAVARDLEALRNGFGLEGEAIEMRQLPALPNTGGTIVLRHEDIVLDSVAYRPGWHRPELRDDRGVSLERREPALPPHAPGAWTSSLDPRGGTPGRANSAALPAGQVPERPGLTASPSPFDAQSGTVIRYTLAAEAGLVRIRVFDGGGRPVRTLEDAVLAGSARTGEVIWDGRDDQGHPLRVGIYIVLVEGVDLAEGRTETYRAPVVLARPF